MIRELVKFTALSLLLLLLVFAAWMEAQPEFSWLYAWQQGTILQPRGAPCGDCTSLKRQKPPESLNMRQGPVRFYFSRV